MTTVIFASATPPLLPFRTMDEIPEKKPKRDWWKRGRAFDLWSIPHFLYGILTGILPSLADISLFNALMLTIVLAILWEWYEKLIGIKETALNIAADFVLPILAFTCTSFLLRVYPLHPNDLLLIFGAVVFLYAYTNISGWLAYRRRNRAFMH